MAAFLAGPLLNEWGWEAVIWVGVPCVATTAAVALAWKVQRRKAGGGGGPGGAYVRAEGDGA